MLYTIYETTNNIDGKKYIGKHVTDNPNDGYLGSGMRLINAINKHGKENFTKRILFVFDNEQEMNEKEIELVNAEIIQDPNYYNIALGGQGGQIVLIEGHPLYEQTKDKIRKSKQSKSEFYRELALEKHASKKNIGMYGKKQSDHQKRAVREAQIGKPKSEDAILKQKDAYRKTVDDPNYTHPNKGRVPSIEERQRISEGIRNRPKLTCQHCGIVMDQSNFKRYHGDKCKHKKE